MKKDSLKLLYQDKWIAIADKPFGLATQGTADGDSPHLYGQLCAAFPYVGLHHRLDTPASGLVLFTLDRTANKAISNGFRHHEIDRRYIAVVAGDPGEHGSWTTPIDEKPATTHFTRLGAAQGMSVIEAKLETGRTHQIRIHASKAGYPIIGDRRHGGMAGRLWPRLALHAVYLSLRHPRTPQTVSVCSQIPTDLEQLVLPRCPHLDQRYSPATSAD